VVLHVRMYGIFYTSNFNYFIIGKTDTETMKLDLRAGAGVGGAFSV
jgi:hypothetical protein